MSKFMEVNEKIAGMVLVALAYPIYNRVLKKQRKKIAPEILLLSDELLKQEIATETILLSLRIFRRLFSIHKAKLVIYCVLR